MQSPTVHPLDEATQELSAILPTDSAQDLRNGVGNTSVPIAELVDDNQHIRDQFSRRMTMKEAVALITFICIISALLINTSEDGLMLAILVLSANALGVLVALWVTYGLGLPNDGSPPDSSS